MSEEQVHRIRRRRLGPAGRRRGLVRFKPQAHAAIIQHLDDCCSGHAVHDPCPEAVADPKPQNLANLLYSSVIGGEINLILFQQQNIQFCDCTYEETGRMSSPWW